MPSRKAFLVLFLLVVMEMLAGFAVLTGSGLLQGHSLYPLFWLMVPAAMVGVAVALTSGMVKAGPPWDRIMLLGVGAVMSGLVSWRVGTGLVSHVVTFVVMAFAYWRGIAASQEPPDHQAVQARFGYGLGAFLLAMVWALARQEPNSSEVWHVVAFLGIGYVLVSMVALVLARMDPSRESGAGSSVALAVISQLAVLLLVSVGGLILFSHDLGTMFFNVTKPLWDVVGLVWVSIWSAVVTPILWLAQFIHGHATPVRQQHQPGQPYHPHGDVKRHLHAAPRNLFWPSVIGFSLLALLIAGIGYLIWRTVPQRPLHRGERGFSEERRWMGPRAILLSLWHWLRSIFRRSSQLAQVAAASTRRRILGPAYPDDPVRQVYARLLRRAQTAGLPRPSAATPVEFQHQLTTQWPAGTQAFAAITDAYVLRRYGEVNIEEEQIQELRGHWHQLRALMRRSRQERPSTVPRLASVIQQPDRFSWLGDQSFVRNVLVETAGTFAAIGIFLAILLGALLIIVLLSMLA